MHSQQEVKLIFSECWAPPGLSLVKDFIWNFYQQGVKVQMGRRVSYLGTSELPLCSLLLVYDAVLWLHQTVNLNMYWSS